MDSEKQSATKREPRPADELFEEDRRIKDEDDEEDDDEDDSDNDEDMDNYSDDSEENSHMV